MSDAELNAIITQAVVAASLADADKSREVENNIALKEIALAVKQTLGVRLDTASVNQMVKLARELAERGDG
jgi:nicotinic acid phosphoribosyltransferase